MLNFYLSYFQKKPIPHFIDKDEDRSKLNPIFDSFRKFSWLTLLDIDFISSIEYLTDTRDLEIQAKHVYLDPHNSEELEALTNPEFYLKGIDYLKTFYPVPPLSSHLHEIGKNLGRWQNLK